MTHTRESIIAFINDCRKNGKRIDLSGQDLSGLDLQDADLRWANLKEANLQGTDLRDAIAELEADNANLNDWLNAWKESFNLAQAEIAKLHADNRSLVEQMNAMAMKQEGS